jgi:hypothetical protein
MLNFNAYIRIVFSSLMILPIIILIFFIINFAKSQDCINSYLTYKHPSTVKKIIWPDRGLITFWFDSNFLVNQSKEILEQMNRYKYSGVISLPKGKSCYSLSLSIPQLDKLNIQEWEVTGTKIETKGDEKGKINEMPVLEPQKIVVYDISNLSNQANLSTFLRETAERNGWIILYFHPVENSPITRTISLSKLKHIFKIVKRSHMPVVLREQVLEVSN